MPRVGQNPMKSLQRAFIPQEVTVCTMVYIPEQTAYWAQSFDVLKVCLNSLVANTGLPHDLVVLDNGSCEEVRAYLVELNRQGVIQILLLANQNLGKPAGWNVLFPACPGKYIAFTDSDCLFYPGWLEAGLRIHNTFDRVGLVTCRPTRTVPEQREVALSATLAYGESTPDVTVEKGDLIPRQILEDFARSTARTGPSEFTQHPFEDVRLTRGGVSAYASAGPWQFIVRRAVAMEMLPIQQEVALGSERQAWDFKVNSRGYLRLTTDKEYVRHLGNVLDEVELEAIKKQQLGETTAAAAQPAVEPVAAPSNPAVRALRVLARNGYARLAMRKTYATLFEALQ